MRRNSIVTSVWLAFALLGASTQPPHAAEISDYQAGSYHSDRSPSTEGELVWNTFLGGIGNELSTAMASDSSGNVYVTGGTDHPWGSPIRAYSGDWDVFVAKVDRDGYLLWNTFLGGSAIDQDWSIAVDTNGEVYVTGSSLMAWGSPIRAYSGNYDVFVAKLSANGALLWNTFLGNATKDSNAGIAVDASGNVYAAGSSESTWGSPIRPFPNDSHTHTFVAKLSGTGSLIWNMFLGGGGPDVQGHLDWPFDIAVDGGGDAYVVGDGFGAWGEPIRTFSGMVDNFVAKIDGNGSLLWNTFLGGTDSDWSRQISVDGSGSVYVAGVSDASWASPIRIYSGDYDAFVARLGSDGSLIWNTFLGAILEDQTGALAVDGNGNAYIIGTSDDTWGSPIAPFGGYIDAFAAKLDSSGSLLWNTFLGNGTCYDGGDGVSLDADGNVYVSGRSGCTWGSPIAPFNVSIDAFVAKLAGPQPPLPDVFITSIKSRSAKPGSLATILGGGFDTSPRLNFVYFDGRKARVNVAKKTSLKVTIPKRVKKGLVDVYVIVDGVSSNTVQFQVK